MTAQTIFVAIALFGANLRMIDSFERLGVVGADGITRLPRRRRRKTKALSDYLPGRLDGDDPDDAA
jgi:hypothetical protein